MAKPIGPRTAVAPRPRVSTDPSVVGFFFPREVVEILGCPELDYAQLRRLFRLARYQFGQNVPTRAWSRYTLRDIAAVREALRLAGGRAQLAVGRHLVVAPVEAACRALLAVGVQDPLLQVALERQGNTVYADVNGSLIDPVTGQAALREVFVASKMFLNRDDADVLARLRSERDRKVRQGPRRVAGKSQTA